MKLFPVVNVRLFYDFGPWSAHSVVNQSRDVERVSEKATCNGPFGSNRVNVGRARRAVRRTVMRKLSPRLGSLILFAGALAFSPLISSVHANPVDVSYTISGAPGDWIVDVSITDNLGGTNDLYFVGIKLPNTN